MPLLATMLDHARMSEQWTICSVLDVPDEQLADQPGGQTNHPAWVLGHLTYALDGLSGRLGSPASRSDDWYEPFKGGTTPVADRGAYPSKSELVDAFADACEHLRTAVENTGETGLATPVEDEQIRAFFPTHERWAVHALLSEVAFHTGQLSAWRRAKGYPPVFDSEENLQRLLDPQSAR